MSRFDFLRNDGAQLVGWVQERVTRADERELELITARLVDLRLELAEMKKPQPVASVRA
jgi:hypothetical protein